MLIDRKIDMLIDRKIDRKINRKIDCRVVYILNIFKEAGILAFNKTR